ncbi:hypothetical protein HQN89_10945 [Paenibacillus frigoriresistens]|uniref:hypothetical protein n=1 Tax=Paenibacillus alginolyticus TaxID=59839 RepID=UPI001566BE17|nr:hypothetical protein [Paenibacillus frigoriresistens]NRF91536.1 hypothetical protein [Paenibacillus frigoriresistens]
MRIRMKTMSAGPEGVMQQGVIYNVSDEEAKALVEGNYAEFVDAVEPPPSDDDFVELTDEELGSQLKHIGGGTFELPDGERVKGKDEAIAALRVKLAEESEEQ